MKKLTGWYVRFLLLALLIQLFGAFAFFLTEMIRRNNIGNFGECVLCFILELASLFIVVGVILSIWKGKLIKSLSILSAFAALLFNIFFLIETLSLRFRTQSLEDEFTNVYKNYMNTLRYFEYIFIFASVAMMFAIFVGIFNVFQNIKNRSEVSK